MENKKINELFKMLESPKQKIMITLPEEIIKELDTQTKKLKYTRSKAIREAIYIWLQNKDTINKENK